MRVLLISILCLSSIQAGAIDPDKWAHFGVSLGLTTACSYLLGNAFFGKDSEEKWQTRLMCGLGVVAIGVSKEYMDMMRDKKRSLDVGDLTADAIGLSLGLGMSWVFKF